MNEDLVNRLANLGGQDLRDVLWEVERERIDQIETKVTQALMRVRRTTDDPRPALHAARAMLEEWAGADEGKRLYADEVDDICRRVGADLSVESVD